MKNLNKDIQTLTSGKKKQNLVMDIRICGKT